jgi:LysM repeat protein
MKKKKKNNRVVEEARDKAIQEYSRIKKPTRMSLEEYVREADHSIDTIKKNIDWGKVGKLKGLSSNQVELVKSIASNITGKDMITYSLTEIMPSKSDGLKNKMVMDMILRTGGREFLEFAPAIFDDRTSFGPYQFTSHALYSLNGKHKGASLINQALPESQQIPGSVIKLRGNDHHKAAYLFVINNIGALVDKLDRKEFNTLWNNYANHKDDLVGYIATAHHRPGNAITAGRLWLANNCRYDFKRSCDGNILEYAKKTALNFKAMNTNTNYESTRGPSTHLIEEMDIQEDDTLHRVSRGETLSSISRQYHVELNRLKNANGGRTSLKQGQVLKIPPKKYKR